MEFLSEVWNYFPKLRKQGLFISWQHCCYKAGMNRQLTFFMTNHRHIINAFKTKPCTDCGIKYPFYVMDFDHLNPQDKKFNLSRSKGKSLEEIRLEIAKCEVVCADCHRIRTHKRLYEDK